VGQYNGAAATTAEEGALKWKTPRSKKKERFHPTRLYGHRMGLLLGGRAREYGGYLRDLITGTGGM